MNFQALFRFVPAPLLQDGGVNVDSMCRAMLCAEASGKEAIGPPVYAAGDVASYLLPLEAFKRVRFEHVQNARYGTAKKPAKPGAENAVYDLSLECSRRQSSCLCAAGSTTCKKTTLWSGASKLSDGKLNSTLPRRYSGIECRYLRSKCR